MGNKNERSPRKQIPATPVDGGTPDVPTAEDFLSRLRPADRPTAEKIVGIVDQLSRMYHGERVNYPGFFAIYGIGGNVTKTGERPDIDLLIVSSARWGGGYWRVSDSSRDEVYEDIDYSSHESESWTNARKRRQLNDDWVCGTIRNELRDEYSAEVLDELPDNYNMGDGTKGLLRLTPIRNVIPTKASDNIPDTRKPIDIVYIRAKPYVLPEESGLKNKDGSRTLEDFEVNADVGPDGNPLPRILLFKAENLGRVNMMHW